MYGTVTSLRGIYGKTVVWVGAVCLVLLLITCGGSMNGRPWLSSTATISGTVSLAGTDLPGLVRVTLDEGRETLTDNDGNFRFDLVALGTHKLEAEALSFKYQDDQWLETVDAGEHDVDLKMAESLDVGATVGVLDTVDLPPGTLASIQDVSKQGDILVLCNTSYNGSGFIVVDVSDPTAPVYLGRGGEGRMFPAARLRMPYLFAGWNDNHVPEGGIAIYDLTVSSDPRFVSEVVTGNVVYAVDLAGDYLYALGREAFQIYDVSDMENPSLIYQDTGIQGEGVLVSGSHAYLSSEDNVLIILDITSPTAPVEVFRSSESDPSGSRDIALHNDSIFVAVGDKIYVYDIRIPSDARLTGVLTAQDLTDQGALLEGGVLDIEGLEAYDGNLYIGGIWDGLLAVDCSDIHRPEFSWQSDAQVPFAMNAYVDPPYAYVAAKHAILRVVRIR